MDSESDRSEHTPLVGRKNVDRRHHASTSSGVVTAVEDVSVSTNMAWNSLYIHTENAISATCWITALSVTSSALVQSVAPVLYTSLSLVAFLEYAKQEWLML